MTIPLCLLLLSCGSRGGLDMPQRRCFQAGITIDCNNVPQIIYDQEGDEEIDWRVDNGPPR